MILPPEHLCITTLEDFFYQESFIVTDSLQRMVAMGGHQEARIWRRAIQQYVARGRGAEADVFVTSSLQDPDLATVLQLQNVTELVHLSHLEADSFLSEYGTKSSPKEDNVITWTLRQLWKNKYIAAHYAASV